MNPFDREIMQGNDYRKNYVTCDDYDETKHVTRDVDLLTAFKQVRHWNIILKDAESYFIKINMSINKVFL